MIDKRLTRPALVAMFLTGATVLADEEVEADWLYLTGEGAWIARTTELRQVSTALPLPVDHLNASTFWWRAETAGLSLNWQTPERKWLVTENSVVQVDDWSGSWTVVQDGSELLVLAQAGVRRLLPRDQWHRLSWVVGQNVDSDFELNVVQPEAGNNPFRYAWFDGAMSAGVRYSLDLDDDAARLRQQLILRNDSDYSVTAPGYSFAQSRDQGRAVMAREMTTMAARSDASAPEAGDSSGQATLVSNQPMTLSSGSQLWLAVESFELSEVRHQYRFNWHTRQSRTLPGQWSVRITAGDDLPDIAGPVQVAVWDQEVALLETHYQPQESNRSQLQLGHSDLLTLATETLSGNEWLLTLTNRNSFSVEASLDMQHWDNDRNEQAGLSLPVPADGEVHIRVRLNDNQLSARPE